ncbi:MAG TPA: c-type cytochrome [Iamia sp.]|nr:c-type cytochrome [Iamia sp.]
MSGGNSVPVGDDRYGMHATVMLRIGVPLALALGLAGCGGDAPTRSGRPDGAALASSLGCTSCHSTDGERRQGPTWKGLAGATVPLADGTTVEADGAYLARSIEDPDADIVEGFLPVMPDLNLDAEQVAALVAHIQELP